MKAEIYTKTNCPYCTKAKFLLKSKDISYTEYHIVADPIQESNSQNNVTKAQLLERAPHARTVPQIWLDGNYIGGYTELAAYFENK